jgi:phenylalanyl-tRNA synthetase beta chain
MVPDDATIEAQLTALGMQVERSREGFSVTPPSHRFDVSIEPDLVEEIARLVGYDAIPEAPPVRAQQLRAMPEGAVSERRVLDQLAARGFNEAVTFAFVDPALQRRLFPAVDGIALTNPISSDLAVMRLSLWPGLLRVILENQRRQQDRLRLFEHGVVFRPSGRDAGSPASTSGSHEVDMLAGALTGPRLPEQWGAAREAADFFDLKGELESVLASTGRLDAFTFVASAHPCLHPGRCARIFRSETPVGWLGELHPELVRALDFRGRVRGCAEGRTARVPRGLALPAGASRPGAAGRRGTAFQRDSRTCNLRRVGSPEGPASFRHIPGNWRRTRSKKRRFRIDFSGQFSHAHGRRHRSPDGVDP